MNELCNVLIDCGLFDEPPTIRAIFSSTEELKKWEPALPDGGSVKQRVERFVSTILRRGGHNALVEILNIFAQKELDICKDRYLAIAGNVKDDDVKLDIKQETYQIVELKIAGNYDESKRFELQQAIGQAIIQTLGVYPDEFKMIRIRDGSIISTIKLPVSAIKYLQAIEMNGVELYETDIRKLDFDESNLSELHDNQLIELMKSESDDSAKAFEVIIKRYEKYIRRVIQSKVQDDSAIDDIVMDTWLSLWEKFDKLKWREGTYSLKLQLFRLARFITISYQRDYAMVAADNFNEKNPQSQQSSIDWIRELEDEIFGKITNQILQESLEVLSDTQRRIVLLYYYENVSIGDIAELMEISTSIVRLNKSRAIRKLQRYYESLHSHNLGFMEQETEDLP